jgi:hypothetical protein
MLHVAWPVVHVERARLSSERHDTRTTIATLEELQVQRVSLHTVQCVRENGLLRATLSRK